MKKNLRIVGFSGSLRKGSYNTSLLKACNKFITNEIDYEILDISSLPFFNEDLEAAGVPDSVKLFWSQLNGADAFIIASPEYNYSFTGVLKNALDWASRGDRTILYNKPAILLSASPGMFGGVRSQYHLRQVCVALNLIPLSSKEVYVMKAHEKIDSNGNITDNKTNESISKIINDLINYTKKHF